MTQVNTIYDELDNFNLSYIDFKRQNGRMATREMYETERRQIVDAIDVAIKQQYSTYANQTIERMERQRDANIFCDELRPLVENVFDHVYHFSFDDIYETLDSMLIKLPRSKKYVLYYDHSMYSLYFLKVLMKRGVQIASVTTDKNIDTTKDILVIHDKVLETKEQVEEITCGFGVRLICVFAPAITCNAYSFVQENVCLKLHVGRILYSPFEVMTAVRNIIRKKPLVCYTTFFSCGRDILCDEVMSLFSMENKSVKVKQKTSIEKEVRNTTKHITNAGRMGTFEFFCEFVDFYMTEEAKVPYKFMHESLIPHSSSEDQENESNDQVDDQDIDTEVPHVTIENYIDINSDGDDDDDPDYIDPHYPCDIPEDEPLEFDSEYEDNPFESESEYDMSLFHFYDKK